MRLSALLGAALCLALGTVSTDTLADETLWQKLQEGRYTVLIRHAVAPGVGDPANFRIEDCSTQRNLNEQGREQSRRLGKAFRSRGIPVGEVRSSQWCRCLETAQLAFGRADPWPALNSNYHPGTQAENAGRNRAVIAEIVANPPRGGNRILVTHNFNIRDLTGVSTASAEMVVVEPEVAGLRVVGTLPVPK
ncbi:MAG: histidine phosphatase family protein [Pseudomonadota bacterium]